MWRLRLGVLLGLVVAAIPFGRVEAAPIFFGFELEFESGPLAGQSFPGTLSVDGNDCPGGVCDGIFDPNGPLDLLSFDVTVDGVAFAMEDALDFDDFPLVGFDNGQLVQINYSALTDAGSTLLQITIGGGAKEFVRFNEAFPEEDEESRGTVRLAVAAPSGLLLLGVGLAALGSISALRAVAVRAKNGAQKCVATCRHVVARAAE